MFEPRLHRLDVLIARASRPGGAYPPFTLATRDVDPEERSAMSDRLDRSPLASVWSAWRDPARTVADRAFALAELEPSMAHVHALAADLWSRDDDARAEPHPALRAALRSTRPALWESHARLLAEFARDFDSDSEWCASRRGFGHYADRAKTLLPTADEVECFARACMALGGGAQFAREALPRGEVAEHSLKHSASGAHAELRPEDFAALECPELLTSLSLWNVGVGPALRTLGRAPHLRTLSIQGADITGDADEGRALAALPLESLTVTVPSNSAVLAPGWIASLPSLRSLTLHYPKNSTDGGGADLPASVCALSSLTSLTVSGVRSLPDSLDRLTELRSLSVRGWYFVGLPPSLVEMTRLETLRVDPTLRLPGVPEGFERLTSLRELRLGHLSTPEVPEALLRMPWLRRLELISGRRWNEPQVDSLRRALPDTSVFVAFTGNAY